MDLLLRDVQELIPVSRSIFGCIFNEALIHQVIVSYMAYYRQGTRAQKSRAEVSGSGKKPWRQKGTGRARAGSIRSPLWRSGGVTFAARPRDYSKKINKKMYRGALKSILSELVRRDRLMVFKDFSLTTHKTKGLLHKLKNSLSCKDMLLGTSLIITKKLDNNLMLASRNLKKIDVLEVDYIDPYSLIQFDRIVMTIDVVKKIEEMLL